MPNAIKHASEAMRESRHPHRSFFRRETDASHQGAGNTHERAGSSERSARCFTTPRGVAPLRIISQI